VCATCGRGGRGYTVKLFKQENRDVEAGPGEVGQIGGQGACLTLGYFDNQQATEDSFNRDGWFLSGDLGRFDEAGNLAIVGRIIGQHHGSVHLERAEKRGTRAVVVLPTGPIPESREWDATGTRGVDY
jgi:acyl-CoA synthetase